MENKKSSTNKKKVTTKNKKVTIKNKKAATYFEVHTHSTRPCGYIRNSYRENGKVKHDTLARINGCTLEQLRNMKAVFDGKLIQNKGENEYKIIAGREYGASALLFELSKKIGLDKIIYSKNEKWVGDCLAMIIGRIIYQGSKLSLSNCTSLSALWEVCGINEENIDVNKHCYQSLDKLLERQDSIQKKLFKKHIKDANAVLYDITSSYLEGEYEKSELVKFGYSRDKKRGHKQITIGLICTKDGCPVAVEVFSGNTSDASTVSEKIKTLKEKYNLKKAVFIGDRGMLTQKNIDKAIPSEWDYVTALTHAKMKELCKQESVQISMFDENFNTEVTIPENPNVRYILKKNPNRAAKETKTRLELISKVEANSKSKTKNNSSEIRRASWKNFGQKKCCEVLFLQHFRHRNKI